MISDVVAGLLPEHSSARPLLDRIEFQRHGRIQGRRTYPDGAQYLISSDPYAPSTPAGPTWSPFVPITSTGVERIREVVRDALLEAPATAISSGPSTGTGTITWVAYLEDGEHVVQTPSGNYDALPSFVRQLDEAVSLNVQRSE